MIIVFKISRLTPVLTAIVVFFVTLLADKSFPTSLNTTQPNLIVVMYHQLSTDYNALNDYVIHPDQFQQDINYLQQNGYTTVTTSQILDFVHNNVPLPEKAVLITFDDGSASVYDYAYPILAESNMSAVLNVLGYASDDYTQYGHLSWEQISELHSSQVFEIGNHTYNLHGDPTSNRFGIKIRQGENLQDYAQKITADITLLNQKLYENCNITTNIFAYPYGVSSDSSQQILEDIGFDIIFTCNQIPNYLPQQNSSALVLHRVNRSSKWSSKDFFNWCETIV